ncbi:alpha/beta hydrolase [Brevibacillus humidisoli]|uniref:alpha/beta hydrolase n=1 Tax=Brevibacillus humidisoli TaxID=2895522 RepID=UPI001E302662|nr:alpha/beta hydrolase [Brevibacillus humidisoli]UFJ42019.1 alpha/beta hydrolase [Brevibacillus humidisoli]
MQQATFQIGPHKMFARIAGNGNEDVVFLHGIPTNSLLWMQIIPSLSAKYRVIAPDLLGYGQSGRAAAKELDLPKQAKYVIGILDQLGVQSAHIVGHDLGGGIAQILAVRYPERVKSMVVVDGVCFSNWPLPPVVALRYPTAPEFEPTPQFIERMLRVGTYHQDLVTPQWVEAFVFPFSHPGGADELQQASLALEHHQTEELVPYLPSIRVPVTLMWGQHDRFLPAYWGARLQEVIPHSHFRVLPQCGHYSMIDNPLLFSQELLQHLQRSAPVVGQNVYVGQ